MKVVALVIYVLMVIAEKFSETTIGSNAPAAALLCHTLPGLPLIIEHRKGGSM